MEKDEYLKFINVPLEGTYKEDEYIVKLKSSEEFMQIYSKLENSEDLVPQDSGVIKSDNTSLYYTSQEYNFVINLNADFDTDEYELVILEN